MKKVFKKTLFVGLCFLIAALPACQSAGNTPALPTENAVATIAPTEMASIKNEPMQDAVIDVQPTDELQIVEGWINGSGFSHEDLLDVRTTTGNAIGNALTKSFVVFDDQGLVSKEPAFIMTNLNSQERNRKNYHVPPVTVLNTDMQARYVFLDRAVYDINIYDDHVFFSSIRMDDLTYVDYDQSNRMFEMYDKEFYYCMRYDDYEKIFSIDKEYVFYKNDGALRKILIDKLDSISGEFFPEEEQLPIQVDKAAKSLISNDPQNIQMYQNNIFFIRENTVFLWEDGIEVPILTVDADKFLIDEYFIGLKDARLFLFADEKTEIAENVTAFNKWKDCIYFTTEAGVFSYNINTEETTEIIKLDDFAISNINICNDYLFLEGPTIMVSNLDGTETHLIEDLVNEKYTTFIGLNYYFLMKNIPADVYVQNEGGPRSGTLMALDSGYLITAGSDYYSRNHDIPRELDEAYADKDLHPITTSQGKKGFYYIGDVDDGWYTVRDRTVKLFDVLIYIEDYFIWVETTKSGENGSPADKEKLLEIGMNLVDGFYVFDHLRKTPS